EVARHLRERFPVEAFIVDAETAPGRLILKDLKQQWRDSRPCLAGAGVAGDQPSATEIAPFPFEARQSHDGLAGAFAEVREYRYGCAKPQRSRGSVADDNAHKIRVSTPPIAPPSAMSRSCVTRRARLMRWTFRPKRRSSVVRSVAW